MRSLNLDGAYRRVPVGATGTDWEKQGALGPFSRVFMIQHTGVPSILHLVDRSGLMKGGRSMEDVLASKEWDAFVRRETKFANWEAMREAALEDATTRQMLKAL